jgi:large subunit ribosomal protein L15
MVGVNVGTIQDYVEMGRLDPTAVLTMKDLVDAGMLKKSSIREGVKLLAKGKERLTTPLMLQLSRASEAAIQAVEDMGGQVTTVHYNRLALRTHLKPEKFEGRPLPKQARPPPNMQAYYTNWDKNRGYLSVQAQMRDLLDQRPELVDAFEQALGPQQQLVQDQDEQPKHKKEKAESFLD